MAMEDRLLAPPPLEGRTNLIANMPNRKQEFILAAIIILILSLAAYACIHQL